MVGNNVESVKIIGRRDLNMNANMKALLDESDEYYYYTHFNDAQELFKIFPWPHLRVNADNKQK